jgi:hypothetical protein
VNVHPASPDVADVLQPQSPTAEPDGQPIESSHLEHALAKVDAGSSKEHAINNKNMERSI